jgi:DNA-binding LytR/AlgR family response regulator
LRVHRNWLINRAYVKELKRHIGGATVTVGRLTSPSKALRDEPLENAPGLRRP